MVFTKSSHAFALIFFYVLTVHAGDRTVSVCKWKGDAKFAFSLILDDFGDDTYTPEILKAGNMAYERDLKIASAAVVKRLVDAGEERWHEMNTFIAQGHEMLNHSWSHDNPTSDNWDNFRDMAETKDSLEAHLSDSVWQKSINFFCFPEDAGTKPQLDSLKEYGYVGARWREGYGGDRVNLGGAEFNPFESDFYGYISKEYGDSVLAQKPNSNYTDWWLTYPDKPYLKYKSPIEKLEQRHLDKAQELDAWGVMEMHSIAPSQLYPDGNSWWSPMSYAKFEGLLDRMQELQECDSLWMDVPSRVASYITLRNGCEMVETDSGIEFDYSAVDERYLTELTLKVRGFDPKTVFMQDGNLLPTEYVSDSIRLVTVNPAKGSIQFKFWSAVVKSKFVSQRELFVSTDKGAVSVIIPVGAYEVQLFDLKGRALSRSVRGVATQTEQITVGKELAQGTYFLVVQSAGSHQVQKIVMP